MPALSLEPTSSGAPTPCLCRPSLDQLMVVPHDCEIDVLQGRHLTQLSPNLQPGTPAQLLYVTHCQRTAGGHDPDVAGERFRLLHAVGADHQPTAVVLQALQVSPGA